MENLNQILQKYLNPPAPDKAERENGSNILREGDAEVSADHNNYQMEWEIRGINGIVAERGMECIQRRPQHDPEHQPVYRGDHRGV